jgi:hypothetical protein
VCGESWLRIDSTRNKQRQFEREWDILAAFSSKNEIFTAENVHKIATESSFWSKSSLFSYRTHLLTNNCVFEIESA